MTLSTTSLINSLSHPTRKRVSFHSKRFFQLPNTTHVTEVQWKRAQETHMFTSEVMKEYGMDALLDYWEQRTRQ